MYIHFNVENNDTEPKQKLGDYVKTSKYKKCFLKGLLPKLVRRSFLGLKL